MDLESMKRFAEKFTADSNEVLEFKLIRDKKDLEDDAAIFKPEMTHQVYGEAEKIFGYKDLQIKLYYTAGHLNIYLGVKYKSKVDPKKFDIKADDIVKPLKAVLPPGVTSNLDEFCSILEKEEPVKPFGKLVDAFTLKEEDGSERQFEIYFCDIETPGFRAYHERLQTFILFFIDAASYIDADDDKWHFFLLFEKFQKDGHQDLAICGYSTIYEYYAYPDLVRPRISQMLVLPPFQGCGLGFKLLNAVYKEYAANNIVRDIAVEDPSESFVRLRDFVDSTNCMKLASFSPENLRKGFSQEMAEEARKKFKMNKKQSRRVYEILRLKSTNVHEEEEYKAYRLDVKSRLNLPFQKQEQQIKKLRARNVSEEEIKAIVDYKSLEERLVMLDEEFGNLENEYNHIISKLEEFSS